MPRSSVKCLNLYDASLLVTSEHYCECCDTYSECFSLSDNGSRHLVIHVIAARSDLYAIAGNVSSTRYTPAMFYNSDRLGRHDLSGRECQMSLCAALFCTKHTYGLTRVLKYYSKECFDTDDAKLVSRSGRVVLLSVVVPS